MKKVFKTFVKIMMVVMVLYCVKVAVIDLWDCYLAVDLVDTFEAVKKMMM